MPCVFPILAMKAAALSRSAHEPAEARRDGLAFLAGVLATFLVLAGALLALRAGGQALGWGFQLQSPGVVAALSLLMLAVALNLSGVFHVGAGLQGAGHGPLARLPGATGAFFTGVLAVVVAAPCTAPFMAFALGTALLMPWPMALAVFLMLGLGLALPYVLISLSPRLLSRLPRPGPWMETLRNLLAFPMYGATLWLAWVYGRQTADALALLFGAGLMLALALWLYGRSQAASGKGRLAGIVAAVSLIAALGLGVLAARAAPASSEAAASASAHLPSQPWSEAAVKTALAEGRPVLVNFTADWCVTCKINEGAALSSPRTAEAMQAANAVYLVGDWTRRDDAITAELQRHGRSGVPLYLLYQPGQAAPRILPQLLTEGTVVGALKDAAR
ncbi:Thiol:disulfide interchange protein DsbD precursor [compost metagenome]